MAEINTLLTNDELIRFVREEVNLEERIIGLVVRNEGSEPSCWSGKGEAKQGPG